MKDELLTQLLLFLMHSFEAMLERILFAERVRCLLERPTVDNRNLLLSSQLLAFLSDLLV